MTATLNDVFKVQDEISRDVVAALKVKLLPTQELPKAQRTNNPEAYQQYLQGRYYLNRFSIADLDKARAFLERACELDPNFPLAWAPLSQVWTLQTGWSDKLTRAEFASDLAHARETAERAIQLDPDLPEALTARFTIQFLFDFDWKGGADTIRRARALAPSDPVILISAAQTAAIFGDYGGAVDLARQAVALDPVNAQVSGLSGERASAGAPAGRVTNRIRTRGRTESFYALGFCRWRNGGSCRGKKCGGVDRVGTRDQ